MLVATYCLVSEKIEVKHRLLYECVLFHLVVVEFLVLSSHAKFERKLVERMELVNLLCDVLL